MERLQKTFIIKNVKRLDNCPFYQDDGTLKVDFSINFFLRYHQCTDQNDCKISKPILYKCETFFPPFHEGRKNQWET